MATSSSCNSIGAAIDKLARLVHHQGPSPVGLDCKKRMDDHGGHLVGISLLMPNNTQASRFASIAVAATAWAGLSMCPVAALAMAYDSDHRNVGESVIDSSTSMLQISHYTDIPGGFDAASEISADNGMHIFFSAEMEAAAASVPSMKPPNEGLNSPWVHGPKKNNDNKRASMRCPKWSQSELEMVLPDFQGRPKPFPRNPFWPAMNDEDESASSMQNDGPHDRHDYETLPSSPATPPQQLHKPIKKPSCYTM